MIQEDIFGGMTMPAPTKAGRKITHKRKGHFTGHLVAGHGAGEVMEVESNLEMNIGLILLARPEVVELENQVPFQWWCQNSGKWHTHHFDFRANHPDGTRTAIMVKRRQKLACPDFQLLARTIAGQVTDQFADEVTIMTDRDVDPVELHNASYLHSFQDTDPEADSAVRRFVSRSLCAVSVGEIVESVALDSRGFRSVGRLLRNHELSMVKRERFSKEAQVCRRAF